MTAPTYLQPALDIIDIAARDWRPSRVQSREAIRQAVMRTASEHKGLVHASDVRTHLPEWVNPQQIGAVICAWTRQGYLISVGRLRENGQTTSRNRTKRSEVRRLVRPIPPA